MTTRAVAGKGLITIVILAGLSFLGWRIYAKLDKTGGPKGPGGLHGGKSGRGTAVAVEVVPVERDTVRSIARLTGTLLPRSEFVVAPKVSGRLESLTVDVGNTVKAGALIARLDDAEYAQQVEQARAELAVARAGVAECRSAMELAQREMGRVKTLFEKKMASESESDEAAARETAAQVKFQVALAEVARREAALKAAEVRLSYTRIHASWEDGTAPRVVGERFVDEGTMLNPNTPIVSILDNEVVIALIHVIERDYPKIRIGQSASITTDAFPQRTFIGKVARIAPLLKETSRQARIEIEIPNPDEALKPGMFVRVQIELDRHEKAVLVPVSALARREGRVGVFLADLTENKVRFVPVSSGITEVDRVEILEPSLSGVVVTLGHHLLEDGASILVPDASRGPRAAQ